MTGCPAHAPRGFHVVDSTNATAKNFSGFTVLDDVVLSAIAGRPLTPDDGYAGNYEALVGPTLIAGHYPIRGSTITAATADRIILWLE